jgi:homopolymeric O-antigen transport system ATP-binding protein
VAESAVVFHHDSLRDLVPALVAKLARRDTRRELDESHEFWALHDVSFEVKQGEALGVIGPNGAGKSTTLKLLTRILRPNRGYCSVHGRVGALIEVAAGFHPDLTGRENIFLQGAVMGMRRTEVIRRFDEIVEFAGLGEFIDMPVKRFSSGMNARLGFSIAAHLDPAVLIIDEVLSVGDASFQKRCIERMLAFRESGTTIVFVSHDLQAIGMLCHKALYLKRSMKAFGAPSEVIGEYLRDSVNPTVTDPAAPVVFSRSALFDDKDRHTAAAQAGASLRLRLECEVRRPLPDLTFGFIVYRSTDHLIVYEGDVIADEIGIDSTRVGSQALDFTFNANLTRGHYHVECYVLHLPTHQYVSRLAPAAMFSVHDEGSCRGVADIALRASARQGAVCP